VSTLHLYNVLLQGSYTFGMVLCIDMDLGKLLVQVQIHCHFLLTFNGVILLMILVLIKLLRFRQFRLRFRQPVLQRLRLFGHLQILL